LRGLSAAERVLAVEAIFLEQPEIIALVEDLDVDRRVELAEPPDLAVLPGDELLVHSRDLDIQVEVSQVEIRGELLGDLAFVVPLDVERARLVVPIDLVEVEEPGELSLARVSEIGAVARQFAVAPLAGGAIRRGLCGRPLLAPLLAVR